MSTMQYQKKIGNEFERYFVLSVNVFQALEFFRRRSRFREYRRAKARWGKRKKVGGYSSVKRNSDLGRKETTFRSYKRRNWTEGGRINIGYANWD